MPDRKIGRRWTSGSPTRPRWFGKVVAFLCSDAARFVSGTALAIDGAATAGLL